VLRKVRASKSRVPPKRRAERSDGKCNREQTARVLNGLGKGETVV